MTQTMCAAFDLKSLRQGRPMDPDDVVVAHGDPQGGEGDGIVRWIGRSTWTRLLLLFASLLAALIVLQGLTLLVERHLPGTVRPLWRVAVLMMSCALMLWLYRREVQYLRTVTSQNWRRAVR
jgi:hypothetical protein